MKTRLDTKCKWISIWGQKKNKAAACFLLHENRGLSLPTHTFTIPLYPFLWCCLTSYIQGMSLFLHPRKSCIYKYVLYMCEWVSERENAPEIFNLSRNRIFLTMWDICFQSRRCRVHKAKINNNLSTLMHIRNKSITSYMFTKIDAKHPDKQIIF